MPHADHFLSRLDRVSSREVELALALYNDAELVLTVLAAAKVPSETERVALPLAGGEAPPHIVVTREGRFVTCLGAGMRPRDLFIVPRATLDSVVRDVHELRDSVATFDKLRSEGRSPANLVKRLTSIGPLLSREDMTALGALAPLILPELIKARIQIANQVADEREGLARLLSRVKAVKPREFEGLERFYRRLWGTAHLGVLTAMAGREAYMRLLDKAPNVPHTLDLTRQGIAGFALRAAWINGRLGRAVLPQLKQRYAVARSLVDCVDTGFGLIAIGLRHSRLQAEVLKALAPGRVEHEPARPLADYFAQVAVELFDNPKLGDDAIRQSGGRVHLDWAKRLPAGSRWRFERAEDVPLDIALGHLMCSGLDFISDRTHLAGLVATLPAAVHSRAEDLYLPQEVVDAGPRVDSVDAAIGVLQGWRKFHIELREAASKRPEGPTRQGPCPCGSGKKYKRCCAKAEGAGGA